NPPHCGVTHIWVQFSLMPFSVFALQVQQFIASCLLVKWKTAKTGGLSRRRVASFFLLSICVLPVPFM
ncbi:hypothetical protein, partial [Lacticaseibacillus manihotivorans]|uniref:hypothetical protein n=1 Tax=Lacticaseibacillus manihotivorans TaxID=88233 RepID=UPI001F2DA135